MRITGFYNCRSEGTYHTHVTIVLSTPPGVLNLTMYTVIPHLEESQASHLTVIKKKKIGWKVEFSGVLIFQIHLSYNRGHIYEPKPNNN